MCNDSKDLPTRQLLARWSVVTSSNRAGDASSAPPMKAIVYRRYGGPEVLQQAELERPVPAAGEVLVRVRASSVNSADVRMMRADPFLVRLMNGFLRPKRQVLGADFAGIVEAVGAGVTRFVPGDEVFGETPFTTNGTFAEFVVTAESWVAKKPKQLSFEQAAAVPLAAVTALQGLRDCGLVSDGTRVLLNGAGGGVGVFAVQIAKCLGAHVTAVCGTGSVELVKRLGADEVIDYSKTGPLPEGRFDCVVGINGHRPLSEYRRALRAGGRYVMIGGSAAQIFSALLFAKPTFAIAGKTGVTLTIDPKKRGTDMAQLTSWLEAGRLEAVIDRQFELTKAAEALAYVEAGHVRGKVVLRVAA